MDDTPAVVENGEQKDGEVAKLSISGPGGQKTRGIPGISCFRVFNKVFQMIYRYPLFNFM